MLPLFYIKKHVISITFNADRQGCGCPVDNAAKQKHRPNRQVRFVCLYAIAFYVLLNKILFCIIKKFPHIILLYRREKYGFH